MLFSFNLSKSSFAPFTKSISASDKSSLYWLSFAILQFVANSPVICPFVIPVIHDSPGVPLYLWYSSSVKS